MKKYYSFIVPIIFTLISFWLVRNHEMWRDEIQAWLLARDSSNIVSLSENLKYEGSPGLWHYILFPLTRIFTTPYSMQVLNILFSTCTILILFNWSPFNKIQKLLLTFSYFLFYEYSIIARSYGLSALLIFTFCALFRNRQKNTIKIAIILFLLSHTSLFGLLMASCFFMTVYLEEIIRVIIKKEKIKV